MKRQGFSVLAAIMVMLAGFSVNTWALSGSGTQASPYLIQSLADFDEFANPTNAATYWSSGVYRKLTCDPNLAGRTYTTAVIAPDMDNSSDEFQGTPFTGVFDANGHIISNLTIDTAGVDNGYLGLFGEISDFSTEVRNLGLENINITGGDNSCIIGGICVQKLYDTIKNCYVNGTVANGNNTKVIGGLCGYNSYGVISNCYAIRIVYENSRSRGMESPY